jgi:ceramide glucosyltransferase
VTLFGFTALLLGTWGYCVLSLVAVLRYARLRAPAESPAPLPISVLKPLSGNEPSLRENLRSLFTQNYPAFEILFAVRSEADGAVAVVRALQEQYPHVPARLLVTGEPPYANAKVFSLSRMTALARYPWLVMSDSDVKVSPDFLRRLSGEISTGRFDLATCPYRAVPGNNVWSLLEALGMDTEFWTSAFVARLVEGVHFTVGPTVVARSAVFQKIPWDSLSAFLAEDFMLGQRAAQAGFKVELSQVVVEHHLSDESTRQNLSHRLRWARSTRRSRPWGYLGQVFTNPLPIALLVLVLKPAWWPLLALTAMLRFAGAYVTASTALGAKVSSQWLLIPVQDLLSFIFWIAGFTGNRIAWRGRRYKLHRDGTFEPVL